MNDLSWMNDDHDQGDELALDIETILDGADEPLSVLDVVRRLVELGHELGAGAEEVVSDALENVVDEDYIPLADDRWIHLPSVLDRRVFTHQLTAPECEYDVLSLLPDLTLLADAGALRLVDGGEIDLIYPGIDDVEAHVPGRAPGLHPEGSLIFPAGTFAARGLHASDLVGLQITDEGIELAKLSRADLSEQAARVRFRLRTLLAEHSPLEARDVLLDLCATVDGFSRPAPPMAELLASLGVVQHGDLLAAPGFDIPRHLAGEVLERLQETYHLEPAEAEVVSAVLTMHDQIARLLAELAGEQPSQETFDQSLEVIARTLASGISAEVPVTARTMPQYISDLLPLLADGDVVNAVFEEVVLDVDAETDDEVRVAALGFLAECLGSLSPRQTRPAMHWLQAKAYERAGATAAAESQLLAAEKLDPTWPLALLDLARIASDRGDAARGLALLRRAAPYQDHQLEELLTRFLPRHGPALGRNDRCWCGSGRKFKVCHLNRPAAVPLTDRAAWLYQKASRYAAGSRWFWLLTELVAMRTAYAVDKDDVARAMRDPLLIDAVLFEGGAFEGFLAERGPLLPADELLLAQQWQLIERSLFEITEARPDESLTVRDLRTGDVHQVRERTASRQLKAGTLICTRVEPAGDTMQIFGGIEEIPMGFRDGLLTLLDSEPGPQDLVAFLTRRFAPPQLSNMDGDSMEFCEAQLQTADAARLIEQLDETFERPDPDKLEWLQLREIEGYDRICATLSLAGSELRLHTNSTARFADALSTMWDLEPEMELINQRRTPASTTRGLSKLAGGRPSVAGAYDPEDAPPEIQEAMAAYLADYERKWLDMSIPALAGLTPRQAADDPTRREDLVRLLASIESMPDSPMRMSSRRLSTALGLDG